MIRILIIFCMLLVINLTIKSYAQYENVWIFGTHAGLNFNVDPPQAITSAIDGGWGEANASVCDANGNLLFYTEGSFVWDRNHNLMPNGSDLAEGFIPYTSVTTTSSAAQGVIIIPVIGNRHQYFIFSLQGMEVREGKLFYSIVDMSLNGGLGDVVTGSKGILIDSLLTEKMSAVVGDRCNIWLMVCKQNANFRAYEITESGLNLIPVESNIGLGEGFVGCISFSSDRKKMAATQFPNNPLSRFPYGCMLADFDPISGQVTNPINLLPQTTSNGAAGFGVAFSPDNSKLYVTANTTSYVLQYDISSNYQDSILSSEINIGFPAMLSHLKLGPDNKIYVIKTRYLDVINNPDQSGYLANYRSNQIALQNGTTAHLGLPNVVPVFRKDTVITTVTDSVPCFVGNSTLLPTDTNGWDYIWSDGSDGKQLHVTGSGTYWVRYYGAPCTQRTDTFHVYIPSGDLPELHFSEAVCKGAKDGWARLQILLGDTTTYTFQWYSASGAILSVSDSLSALPPGDYRVQITTSGGCDTTLFFKIAEADHRVSFSSDTLICLGASISFTNTSDVHFDTFLWLFDDGNTSTSRNALHTYSNTGTYNTQLIGKGAICTDTVHTWITVDAPLSKLEFDAEKEIICKGEQIQFYTSYAGLTYTGFEWQLGDGVVFATADTAIAHAYDSDGEMFIKLTAQFRACPDITHTKSVFVHPLPLVSLGTDSSLCLHGSSITLQNHYPYQEGDQYLWSTGNTSPVLNVYHQGIYYLQVTSAFGCTAQETVEVIKDCYVNLPNAFTPDGDGLNDEFFPRQLLTKGVASFKIQILNRWGQKVFESMNPNGRGWDGSFNGDIQPKGVYVYLIDVVFQDGETEHYQGNVTLIK